ncbi:putative amidohydrolase [Panacagrimonas perspica]|uniref:Putative amidohydrolase n=1 Tax=Panacagrimonas perspica TaxID=381431 RepID=A0A4R7P2X4_9GAMM|nr:carbon-nitrogen hydrolase family protein [Panacagrimonas perspica]TDU27977.1 putative amidohydrolase [Panacagrimonas perspica]THD01255.1 amidohydrolase [Panacagrimonas perspica]
MSTFLVATAQYPVSAPESWAAFEAGVTRWVDEAADRDAKLLVFPEYASMVLPALFAEAVQADLIAQLDAMQGLRDAYVDLHRRLARERGVYLLAGSFPWRLEDGHFVNRAWFCAPSGDAAFQDKQVMTRFEREHWKISTGEPLRVFETSLGVIGIAICYDSEFPLLVRAQVEAGAELLLVPSCTDAAPGYHRVRIAARARALESQCPVVMSPLVGAAPWSPAIDTNTGTAGVYGPPDRGFPDDGVIAQGQLDVPGWTYARIDLAPTREVRRDGQVLNLRHWPEGSVTAAVERVSIT